MNRSSSTLKNIKIVGEIQCEIVKMRNDKLSKIKVDDATTLVVTVALPDSDDKLSEDMNPENWYQDQHVLKSGTDQLTNHTFHQFQSHRHFRITEASKSPSLLQQ